MGEEGGGEHPFQKRPLLGKGQRKGKSSRKMETSDWVKKRSCPLGKNNGGRGKFWGAKEKGGKIWERGKNSPDEG